LGHFDLKNSFIFIFGPKMAKNGPKMKKYQKSKKYVFLHTFLMETRGYTDSKMGSITSQLQTVQFL
jgi:hypothetical protein